MPRPKHLSPMRDNYAPDLTRFPPFPLGQQLYREIRSGQGPRFSTPMLDGVQSLVSTLAAAVGRLQSVLADRLARLQIRPQTSQLNILMRTVYTYTCMYMHVPVCVSMRVCLCECVSASVCVCVCECVCECECVCVCVLLSGYECVCVCVGVLLPGYECVCMCVYVCVSVNVSASVSAFV